MKVIVIGGVASGMSASSKIKRMDKSAEVVVYEKGGFLSYGACGLPYFVGGFNDDYRKMIARTKEQFESIGIKTNLHCEVLKVIPEEKKVFVLNHETKDVFIDTYDKLLISTGARAIEPNIEGKDANNIYYLKSLEDGLVLKEKIQRDSNNINNVVVVGGGYIGIEVVDAFLHLGKNVTCVEFANTILTPFEPELVNMAVETLKSNGVNLKTGEKVVKVTKDDNGNVVSVVTDKGEYKADLVVFAVGVKPNTDFLTDTNIELAKNGAIIVDREMRTSVEDIWAAGDCSLVYHKGLEENVYLPLGTVANKCGRIVGENILGYHKKFVGALGSAGIKVVDLEMGRTGLSEADAKRLKLDYSTSIVKSYDHPAYYPNPTPLLIKIIYENGTKKLLGAQVAGEKGAVLRVDIFATAIHSGMSTDDLGFVDLVYAPPFAGVWDAVQIACNSAK